MDVVAYFKASALAKWKLHPAQRENYLMSVDGGFHTQTSRWEASMLLRVVHLICWHLGTDPHHCVDPCTCITYVH